jgi:hypothetical protein
MAKYKKIVKDYDVLEYTGDLAAVIAFGVPKTDAFGSKDIQVGIPTDKGVILCAVGDYITKDQFGNFEVVPKLIFKQTYSDKI